jgi:hypothetical protein
MLPYRPKSNHHEALFYRETLGFIGKWHSETTANINGIERLIHGSRKRCH